MKTRDELLFEVAELCKLQNITPQRAMCNLIKRAAASKKSINARGSSFNTFYANPLHFAIQQFLGVSYGSNHNTIVGNAVHEAAHFGFDYKIKNKQLPRLIDCTKILLEDSKKNYKYINADSREEHSLRDIQKQAFKLFVVYYKSAMQTENCVESEKSFKLSVPTEMLASESSKALGKIMLTGTFDRLFKVEGDKLCLSDLKTSKTPISSKVKHPEALAALKTKQKELHANLKTVEKQLIKEEKLFAAYSDYANELKQQEELLTKTLSFNYSNLIDTLKADNSVENKNSTIEKRILKNNDLIKELNETAADYEINIYYIKGCESFNAYRKITNKLDSLYKLVDKNKESSSNIEELTFKKESLLAQLDELFLELEPLEKEYKILKYESQVEEAKKKYGTQLTFYAMMYMITEELKGNIVNIDCLRVEVLIKSQNPYLQEFQWDLNEFECLRTEEKIQTTISAIEAVFNGIDPMLMFTHNQDSFFGSETNLLIDEVNGILMQEYNIA